MVSRTIWNSYHLCARRSFSDERCILSLLLDWASRWDDYSCCLNHYRKGSIKEKYSWRPQTQAKLLVLPGRTHHHHWHSSLAVPHWYRSSVVSGDALMQDKRRTRIVESSSNFKVPDFRVRRRKPHCSELFGLRKFHIGTPIFSGPYEIRSCVFVL